MKKWIPKILAYLIMIPIVLIGIVGGIIWNIALIGDYIFRDMKRVTGKELKSIKKNDKVRAEEKKQKQNG
jgi:beta-lactamase regulating signal transducer with metallopeptidase domain